MAAALAAATLAAGCSSSDSSSSKVDRSTFRPNETRFAKPLDDYLVTNGDDFDFAIRLVTAKCMTARGYRFDVANPENFQGAALAVSIPLSVRRAERYGYHIGQVRGGTEDSTLADAPQAEQDAADACGRRAQAEIGLDAGVENDVNALAFTADDEVSADAAVKAAATRWRACMVPLGIPDLPRMPTLGAMPSRSQHNRFWRAKFEYVARDPEEIRQAVFDAKCRTKSGWDSTYYRSTVDHQFDQMDQHPGLLAKALDQKRRVDARIAAVLRSNGN